VSWLKSYVYAARCSLLLAPFAYLFFLSAQARALSHPKNARNNYGKCIESERERDREGEGIFGMGHGMFPLQHSVLGHGQ